MAISNETVTNEPTSEPLYRIAEVLFLGGGGLAVVLGEFTLAAVCVLVSIRIQLATME